MTPLLLLWVVVTLWYAVDVASDGPGRRAQRRAIRLEWEVQWAESVRRPMLVPHDRRWP